MDYEIIRSSRRTISLEITEELCVKLRIPYAMNNKQAKDFLKEHQQWIEEKLQLMEKRNEFKRYYTDTQIQQLRASAKSVIPSRVEFYSKLMNLYTKSVKITSAKKRFGSCSGKNGLCFSLYLMDYPIEAIDYVVVHEIAHIKYHNHSSLFWSLVKKYMPDYKERKSLLSRVGK